VRRELLAAVLLALGASPGCGSEAQPVSERAASSAAPAAEASPAPAKAEASDEDREELMDKLRGLGYVEWDPGADAVLTGVTLHDPKRAEPGYNIYAGGDREVFLVDMDGKRVHTWHVPEDLERCTFAELLHDDTLAVVCNYRRLVRLDWNSRVIWEIPVKPHHDVAERSDGTLLVPYRKVESLNGRKVRFDGIAYISPEGEVFSRWYTWEHRDDLDRYHLPSRLDRPMAEGEKEPKKIPDYYHLNSVELLPDTDLGRRDPRFRAGNVLVCLRNVNLVAVLDQDTMSVVWSWGTEELEGAHMPTMLPDGHILVFDNGVRRKATRVIEVDPETGEIAWSFQGTPPESFYSQLRGSNQRLANGNTLICEADRGHVIEVTPAGERVWEFWNPELKDGNRKRIYRFMRLPVARIAPLLAKDSSPAS